VKGDLVKAAKQGKGAAVKVAAADALAVCCFVAAEDEHTTQEVMDQLYLLWGKGMLLWVGHLAPSTASPPEQKHDQRSSSTRLPETFMLF